METSIRRSAFDLTCISLFDCTFTLTLMFCSSLITSLSSSTIHTNYLNRILSLDPKRFSRQLLYHASNKKQKTVKKDKFVRVSHFLGQLYTVKERALHSLMG